jgi:uncharacterized membrane protein
MQATDTPTKYLEYFIVLKTTKKMKMKTITAVIMLFVSGMLFSCYYDNADILYGSSDCSNASVQAGPKFTSVDSLIILTCSGSGCHTGGGNAGGYSFNTKCDVVNSWAAIQSACVNRSSMPQGNPFNAAQKQIITNWVNAGHKYTD